MSFAQPFSEGEVLMNTWALLIGSMALVAIVTIYYVWLRKPAAAPKQEQPQQS
jgi:hypothetical protein